MRAIPAPSPCVSSCVEFATNRRNATVDGFESFEQGVLVVHEEDVESRYGLRGVRVGEASHPGPPRRHISRPIEGRDVIPRVHPTGATQRDEDVMSWTSRMFRSVPGGEGFRVTVMSRWSQAAGSRF